MKKKKRLKQVRVKAWQGMFLKTLRSSTNITIACAAVNITRQNAYYHRNKDKKFRQAWDLAIMEGVELLEQSAKQRAFEGVDVPVYYHGQIVGHTRVYDTALTVLFLKAYKPEVFRDTTLKINHSGRIGTNVDDASRIEYVPVPAIPEDMDDSFDRIVEGKARELETA